MSTESLVWSAELPGVLNTYESSTAYAYELNRLTKSNVTFSGNKLFYSNNPESLTKANNKKMLGTDGRWLAKKSMNSNFRFYSWHANLTNETLKHWFTIKNNGASPLTVTLKRLKVGKKYCDAQDLADYLSGVGDIKSVTVPANGWNTIVLQENIYQGQVLSAICDVEFNGSAVFYDIAVPQSFSGSISLMQVADSQADGNTLYIRGVADHSVASIVYPRTIMLSELESKRDKMMIIDMLPSKIDNNYIDNRRFINSPEVLDFKDDDGKGGYMGGCYATEYYLRIPIKNNTETGKKNVVLRLGSSYAKYGIVVNMNNGITPTKAQRPDSVFDCETDAGCREVIKITGIEQGETHEIHFRMMVPGGSGSSARFYLQFV